MKDDGTPIHPEKDQQGYNPLAFPSEKGQNGMTLLDYIASKAMNEHLEYVLEKINGKPDYEGIAKESYNMANEMLKERQKYFNNENNEK